MSELAGLASRHKDFEWPLRMSAPQLHRSSEHGCQLVVNSLLWVVRS